MKKHENAEKDCWYKFEPRQLPTIWNNKWGYARIDSYYMPVKIKIVEIPAPK